MKYSRLIATTALNLELLKQEYPSLSASEVIAFMRIHKQGTKDHEKFAELAERSIQKNEKLNILYTAKTDDFEQIRRVVSPLAFQVKSPKSEGGKQFIYLCSYNTNGDVRTYRFDRIQEMKTTSKPAKYDGDYDPFYDYYSDDIIPDFYNSDAPLLEFGKELI